jgi:hypothetical protein
MFWKSLHLKEGSNKDLPSFFINFVLPYGMPSYKILSVLQSFCTTLTVIYKFGKTGLVSDDDISKRESRLREVLQKDTQYRVKENSVVEVAQVKVVLVVLDNKV